MTDFYIFRHGDTVNTGKGQIIHKEDTSKLAILPKGIGALKKIGDFLKDISLNENYSSPYLRCKQSAEIVCQITKSTYIEDARIREFDGGEKFSSLCKRVNNFLLEIKRKEYSAVSICTHGADIAAIKHLAMEKQFNFSQLFDYPQPGNLIIIKGNKISSIDFNTE